jgi:hypothetical protein
MAALVATAKMDIAITGRIVFWNTATLFHQRQ